MNSREILLCLSLKYEGRWEDIYNGIQKKESFSEQEKEELTKNLSSKYITFLDEEYPKTLKESYRPPCVLFYYGDISLISDANNKLSVVGSRKNSSYGGKVTKKLVSELCKDFVIISGLAIGIDSIAHRSAISYGGRTVAVLGNGIDFCYIKENIPLYEECKKTQLVISEYPNHVPPKPENFPVRNRIIAGLCRNLLITEGKISSGT